MHWLPESESRGRVVSTGYFGFNITLSAAAFGNKWRLLSATIAIVIVAILGSSRCDTKVARCWRQKRAFWLKVKSEINIYQDVFFRLIFFKMSLTISIFFRTSLGEPEKKS